MLPEFSDGTGLPAAARFGPAFRGRQLLGEVLADVSGHRSAGTMEVVAASQFVSQECKIERLAVRQELFEEIVSVLWPGGLVVATRGAKLEAGAVLQPLVSQFIQARRTDHEPLGCGRGVECTGIEGVEDFLHKQSGNTMSELLFFIGRRIV